MPIIEHVKKFLTRKFISFSGLWENVRLGHWNYVLTTSQTASTVINTPSCHLPPSRDLCTFRYVRLKWKLTTNSTYVRKLLHNQKYDLSFGVGEVSSSTVDTEENPARHCMAILGRWKQKKETEKIYFLTANVNSDSAPPYNIYSIAWENPLHGESWPFYPIWISEQYWISWAVIFLICMYLNPKKSSCILKSDYLQQ